MEGAPGTPLGLLARAAAGAPGEEALVAGALRLDYAGYAAAVAGFAAQLEALGAGGRRVALLLGNAPQMAIALFAVHAAGATVVPLNPDYSARELAPLLARAAPAIVVAFPAAAETLRSALGDDDSGTLLLLPDDAAAWLGSLPGASGAALPCPPPDSLALIQFTGGTTGAPKGVMLTHAAIATNVAQREERLPTAWAGERILGVMPLYHSFASAMGHLAAANCAGALHLLPRYRPDQVQEACEREALTRLPAGPTLIQSLLLWECFDPAAFASVRSVWSGSAPLPADTLARWEAATGIPIHEGYGQTEAGPVLTYHGPGLPLKPRSVGPPLRGTDIRILDPATRQPLPPGSTGHIVARGPQIMAGYLDDPGATAEALRDGWLETGDIGHLDEDHYLFITDRSKDMAIVGGYNVYPREVDEALATLAGVTAVAAVAVPDRYRGEVLWAYVAGEATEAALRAHADAHLARYKRPVCYRFGPLPLTPVGKVDKAELRRRARAELEGAHVA